MENNKIKNLIENYTEAKRESKEGNALSDIEKIEIVREVKQNIVVPTVISRKIFLICPVGLIASGKSTILKMIASRLNMVVVSTDQIRWLLQDKGYNLTRTVEIAFEIVMEFVEKGYPVAIDADCSARESIGIVDALSAEYNLPVVWIKVETPEAEILKRLDISNKDRKYTGDKAIKNYYRRKVLHLDLKQDFFYTFDGSKDLEKQVNEFMYLLKKDE